MVSKAKNRYCFLVIVVLVTILIYICLKEESKSNNTKFLQHHEPRYQHYQHDKYKTLLYNPAEATLERNSALQGHPKVMIKDTSNHQNRDEINIIRSLGMAMDGDAHFLAEKAMNRSLEYCNPPEKLKTGDEGKVTEGFTLRSVHIIIRHGDRSPMYKLPNQDSPHLSCHLDASVSTQNKDLVESFILSVARSGSNIPYGLKFGCYPRQKTCMGAQLTGRGVLQHLVNGALLNRIYVQKLGLVNEKPAVGDLVVRSTDYSRTYQSALAFMHGLLPGMDLARLPLRITSHMNFCDDEASGVSCHCPIINQLREFAKKEEMKMKSNITSYQIAEIKREVAAIYGMSTQHVPWIGGIVEVLMGYICHGLPLPCTRLSRARRKVDGDDAHCIKMPLIGKMWRYVDARGHIALSGRAEQKYNILFMYPLLRELAQQLLNLSQGNPAPKITLYSGHDITLTPLIKALGIYDGHWVPYGSRFIIETYSSPDAQYYIRVLYNGNDLTSSVKFCRSHLVHNLCPLQYFVDFSFQEIFRIFKNTSYKQICKS